MLVHHIRLIFKLETQVLEFTTRYNETSRCDIFVQKRRQQFFEIFPNLFKNLLKKNICLSIYVDIRNYIAAKQQILTSLENADCLVQF